jgi:hypothetical protein
MREQLDKLKERAEWHESMADGYQASEEPHAQGAACYHWEKAQQCWMEYGRLVARIETAEEWGKDIVLLPGRVMI